MNAMNKLILISVAVFSIACGSNGSFLIGGSDMPEHPEKIVIEWSDGGGMLPEGESIYISEDSCYWNFWRNQNDQHVNFTATKFEIDSVYKICRDYRFDKIKLDEENEVYDRGGTSIRIVADGKYFDKNNSGMTFLAESTADDYYASSAAIYGFAKSKIEEHKSNVKLTFDEKLFVSNFFFIAYIDGNMIFNSEKMNKVYSKDSLIYTASHEFEMSFYFKDSLNYYGNHAYAGSTFLFKNIEENSQEILFTIEENKPVLK